MDRELIFTTPECKVKIGWMQIGHDKYPRQTVGYRRLADNSVVLVRYNDVLGWRSDEELPQARAETRTL